MLKTLVLIRGKFVEIPEEYTPEERAAEIKRLEKVADDERAALRKQNMGERKEGDAFANARWLDDDDWHTFIPDKSQPKK